MPHFRPLLLIACLALSVLALAESDPARLLLLRGAVALAEKQHTAALGDLRRVALMRAEDWQAQWLYGEALLAAQAYPHARGQLRRATLLAPWRPEAWAGLATLGRVTGDSAMEQAALLGVLRVLPDDPPSLRRLRELARAAGDARAAGAYDARFQATLPRLRFPDNPAYRGMTLPELRAQAARPEADADLYHAIATAAWRGGDGYATRDALAVAHAQRPHDTQITTNYAHLCLLTGDLTTGLTALSALDDDSAMRATAHWATAADAYGTARAAWARLRAAHPTDALASRALGTLALLEGDLVAALPALEQAYKLGGAESAHQYAAALTLAGRSTDAIELLRQAQRQYPTDDRLAVLLANVYRDALRLRQAAELNLALAATRPERTELLLIAGERYLAIGLTGRAVAVARTLRDSAPDDLVAIQGAVRLFRRANAASDAQLTFTRFLSPNYPSSLPWPTIMLEIARDAIDHHELPEALAALDALLARDQATRDAYLLMGNIYSQQGQWTRALDIYTQGLQRWRTDADLLLAHARAARHLEKMPLAIQSYRRATASTATPEPWLEMAEVYLAQQDMVNARIAWRAAADFPTSRVRAFTGLRESYRHEDASALLTETDTLLRTAAASYRQERHATIKAVLTTRGLAPSEAELDALLRLDPEYREAGADR